MCMHHMLIILSLCIWLGTTHTTLYISIHGVFEKCHALYLHNLSVIIMLTVHASCRDRIITLLCLLCCAHNECFVHALGLLCTKAFLLYVRDVMC